MSITKICKVDDCSRLGVLNSNGKRYLAKGMCNMHYRRVYTYGKEATMPTRFTARPATIDGEIALLPLGVGAKDGYAVVDRAFAKLDKYKWSMNAMGYAVARIDNKLVYLHKIIMPQHSYVDHKDRDKLNNRVSNLRQSTHSQNMANKVQINKTGFKGVTYAYWLKKDKWVARICKDAEAYYLGLFSTPEEAACAYDKKAIELFGDFAVLNKAKEIE